jgi:hypothetical protein
MRIEYTEHRHVLSLRFNLIDFTIENDLLSAPCPHLLSQLKNHLDLTLYHLTTLRRYRTCSDNSADTKPGAYSEQPKTAILGVPRLSPYHCGMGE